jgi:hypothetical protein
MPSSSARATTGSPPPPDGLSSARVRTRETMETVAGTLVVSAGATVVVCADDGEARPLAEAEREALLA